MGKTQRAATIFSFLMITAPSCKGLFLKKILSNNRLEVSALIVSPVLTKLIKSDLLAITIKAPVLNADIFEQAFIIELISMVEVLLSPKENKLSNENFRFVM